MNWCSALKCTESPKVATHPMRKTFLILFAFSSAFLAFVSPSDAKSEKPASNASPAKVDPQTFKPDDSGFKTTVQPFVQEYCISCHGSKKQKGDLRLDTLENRLTDPGISAKWAEVLNVLNRHEMPPEDEKQPSKEKSAMFATWLEHELSRAEVAKRSTRVVLRRMNRAEYNNTIRDLVGVDYKPADKFPEDPPAGGFDNIGQALSISPMQIELYYAAARQILDRALVQGAQPASIKWRFEPEENNLGNDRYRVQRDNQKSIILNMGKNPVENGFTIIHHDSWDKHPNVRNFNVPSPGEYVVRFRAAGRTPDRTAVVQSARPILEQRRDEQTAKKPEGQDRNEKQMQNDLQHFATHSVYEYGPPRLKLVQNLGGTPKVLAEMDIDATEDAPREYEVRGDFNTQSAAIEFLNSYEIPKLLENFWMQGRDEFARPTLLLDWIELEGPIHPVWPPKSHQNLLHDSPNRDTNETAYAEEVVRRFMERAYRRPVQKEEVASKLALFLKQRPQKETFMEAIKVPLAAVLASPHFLYLIEPEESAAKPRKLSPYETASRLSYFLWSSMPDETLLGLARSGELQKAGNLKSQMQRMLADEKSSAFVKNFTGQWLGLRKVGANPPSKTLYPEYDRHFETSIVQETEAFFAEILKHNLDARNLIKSDFVTINERLARFYHIPGVKGDAIRKVPSPPESHRGGIITQASIHSITSNGTRTSPVVRGVWILRTLLGSDPGLPVANVGEIQSSVPGIDKATVRQRLAIHRETPSCARCHDKIDPLGLALENFNATGEWRDQEGHGYNGRIDKNDPVIDASAKMPDGTEFKGVEGLQEQLLKQEDLFLTALASQLTTYALGRELGFSDRVMIREFVAAMKKQGYTLESLLSSIITSNAFVTK